MRFLHDSLILCKSLALVGGVSSSPPDLQSAFCILILYDTMFTSLFDLFLISSFCLIFIRVAIIALGLGVRNRPSRLSNGRHSPSLDGSLRGVFTTKRYRGSGDTVKCRWFSFIFILFTYLDNKQPSNSIIK